MSNKNWRDAKFVQTWTPRDVYGDSLESVLAGMKDSFLQIVGFEIPKPTDFYLTVFGHVNQDKHVDTPHFIVDLNPINGKIICPKCTFDGTPFGWAQGTDYVGCPACGTSVIRLRLKEWGDRQ